MAIVLLAALGIGVMAALGISPRQFFGAVMDGWSGDGGERAAERAQRKDLAALDGDLLTAQEPVQPLEQQAAISPKEIPAPAQPSTPLEAAVAPSAPPAVVETPRAPAEPSHPQIAALPPASPPALTPQAGRPPKLALSASEIQLLLSRANEAIELGNVASARLLLSRAARAEDPVATLLLANTYDPNMLARWKSRGVKADVARARELYEQARQLGAAEADAFLAALN